MEHEVQLTKNRGGCRAGPWAPTPLFPLQAPKTYATGEEQVFPEVHALPRSSPS